MNRMLIIAASSDLSISYLESIKNDKLDIDVIVRDSSRIPENILSMIDEIYEFDLNDLESLNRFISNSKYSQIIFFHRAFYLYDLLNIA